MSAALALKTAHAVGIRVRVDGDDLELEAPAQPPQAVLDLLSLHKADILRLLRPANDGWSPEDWQVFFDERAAIAEFDGGLSRAEAEARAFACCVAEWINRNRTPSAPGRCLACGGGERPCDPLRAVRDRRKRSCLAASRVLAGMVSGARGRGYRGTCFDGHSIRRTGDERKAPGRGDKRREQCLACPTRQLLLPI